MAKAHVYVRVQVSGSNADCQAVQGLADALRDKVLSMGGEFPGHAHVELDAVSDAVAEVPVAEHVPVSVEDSSAA